MSVPNRGIMIRLCGDIRISATRGIKKSTELTVEAVDICRYDRILVGGASKVITETSSGSEINPIIMGYDFRGDISSSSHNCHVGLQNQISNHMTPESVKLELTHDAGKDGRKPGVFLPSLVRQNPSIPTPWSPLAKRTETPRAPNCANKLQTEVA